MEGSRPVVAADAVSKAINFVRSATECRWVSPTTLFTHTERGKQKPVESHKTGCLSARVTGTSEVSAISLRHEHRLHQSRGGRTMDAGVCDKSLASVWWLVGCLALKCVVKSEVWVCKTISGIDVPVSPEILHQRNLNMLSVKKISSGCLMSAFSGEKSVVMWDSH